MASLADTTLIGTAEPHSAAGEFMPSSEQARRTRLLRRIAQYLFALAVMGVIVVPLMFSILGGFRSSRQLVENPVGLPDPWIFENYANLLRSGTFWRQVWNSTFIALLTVGFTVPVASLAAFVLARYPFKGRELVYGLFTLGLLFPVAVAILPLFVTLRQIGLLSNTLGVALPQDAIGLPVAIIIMRPFLRAIPSSLQDAALIDGCGPLRFYWYVILPLSRPVLSTVAILGLVGSWNGFLLPLLVLIDPAQHTLPIGVNNTSSQFATDYSVVLAYTTLSMIPALIFYALAERQIVSGLTDGAVKA